MLVSVLFFIQLSQLRTIVPLLNPDLTRCLSVGWHCWYGIFRIGHRLWVTTDTRHHQISVNTVRFQPQSRLNLLRLDAEPSWIGLIACASDWKVDYVEAQCFEVIHCGVIWARNLSLGILARSLGLGQNLCILIVLAWLIHFTILAFLILHEINLASHWRHGVYDLKFQIVAARLNIRWLMKHWS